jgi:hypothetical protein
MNGPTREIVRRGVRVSGVELVQLECGHMTVNDARYNGLRSRNCAACGRIDNPPRPLELLPPSSPGQEAFMRRSREVRDGEEGRSETAEDTAEVFETVSKGSSGLDPEERRREVTG